LPSPEVANDAQAMEAYGHTHDKAAALFRPIRNNRTGERERALFPDGIYKLVRRHPQKLP
jgi:integrase/recombinase XerD